MLRACLSLLAILMISSAVAETADAQILNRVRDRVAREAERRVEDRMVNAARRAMDATEDAIVCVATDPECIQAAREDGSELVIVNEAGEAIAHENAPGAADPAGAPQSPPPPSVPAAPDASVWANYDFVPGDRVIFYEDFASDFVGDFPRRLEFRQGNIEVVEWDGGRAIRVNTRGAFDVHLPEVLPDRFTLEFDAYLSELVNDFQVFPVDVEGRPAGANLIQIDGYDRHGVGLASFERGGISALQGEQQRLTSQMMPIRVMADGSYVKVYVDERRVANVPNADLGRGSTIRFDFTDVRSEPILVGPIRIAAGGREMMADRLAVDGRLATHGILFDTGSASIRPESSPTLQDIARALEQRPDMRLRIEGHTDSSGSAEANLRLSEQRAHAVVDYLVRQRGIAAGRLEAAGLGQEQPVADNATSEGRQTNRRVELVVID